MPHKTLTQARTPSDVYKCKLTCCAKKIMPEENADRLTQEDQPTPPVKKAAKKATIKRNSPKKKAASAGRGPAWTFPKNTLEEAIGVAKAVEEQNAGNPMKADMLVKAVGFNKASDWRFQDLLRSSNQYGLVLGTGATATVKLEQIGQDIVAPSSPTDRQVALRKAFDKVEDFQKVADFYKGKKLPEDEFFENTLVREFGVQRDRVGAFINIFTQNLKYIRAFTTVRQTSQSSQEHADPSGEDTETLDPAEQEERTRTFLDTCFVMMPFGPWFDSYYKDIYIPAIKEAGLEPMRADELFSTGAVIEQIWEQIDKSKVLLADLTNKNANVFYELGLAHAALKPVVFTAASLEDVPFDLRHLRVVTYDLNDPFWGEKLKKELTKYLKKAKSDPEKSIPQPFREIWKPKNS